MEFNLPAEEARHIGELLREDVLGAAGDDGNGAHAQRAQLVHGFGLRRDVDRLVVDAEAREELLDPHAARTPGTPVDLERGGSHGLLLQRAKFYAATRIRVCA